MASAPTPTEKFERAVEEGQRRLDQSLLELVSTSVIAGFTIVFGIVALGIVEAAVEPQFGHVARIAGALAFGFGLVFLVVGRAELFNENFFDPTAAAIDGPGTDALPDLGRLWVVTFAGNLVGGGLFVPVFVVEGVLPPGTAGALREIAATSFHESALAWFAGGFVGGALVTLLSFLLAAVASTGARVALAYVVGVMLTLGPFDHVVVTALHLVFGVLFGVEAGLGQIVLLLVVVTAGNLVGGLGLVTLTHVTQVIGAEEADE